MPEAKFAPLQFFGIASGEMSQILLPTIDAFIRWPVAVGGEFFGKTSAGCTQALKLVELGFEPVGQMRCRDRNRINSLPARRSSQYQNLLPGPKARWKPKSSPGFKDRRNRLEFLAAGRDQPCQFSRGILSDQKKMGGSCQAYFNGQATPGGKSLMGRHPAGTDRPRRIDGTDLRIAGGDQIER